MINRSYKVPFHHFTAWNLKLRTATGEMAFIAGEARRPSTKLYGVFSLTWPASMQIYWKKRKPLHKKRVQLPQDWFETPTWLPWRHVKTLYTGRLCPTVWPRSLLYTILDRKIPPIIYIVLINGIPFKYCLELCSPFNCCKCIVFLKTMNKSQNKYDFRSFSQPKMRPLVGF